jgi:hypothetical protein
MSDGSVSVCADHEGKPQVTVPTDWFEMFELGSLFAEIVRSYNGAMIAPDLVDIPESASTMSLGDFVSLGNYLADVRAARSRLMGADTCPEMRTGDLVRATWRGRRLMALAVPPSWGSRTPAQRIVDEITEVLSSPPQDPQIAARASFTQAVSRLRAFGDSHG